MEQPQDTTPPEIGGDPLPEFTMMMVIPWPPHPKGEFFGIVPVHNDYLQYILQKNGGPFFGKMFFDGGTRDILQIGPEDLILLRPQPD